MANSSPDIRIRSHPFTETEPELWTQVKIELEHGINLEYKLHESEVVCGICKKYFIVGQRVNLLLPCRDVLHQECSEEALGDHPCDLSCPICYKLIRSVNSHKMRREGDPVSEEEEEAA